MSEEASALNPKVTAVRFGDWPTTSTRPTPPLVTLVFTGLTMFCYNRDRTRCEIGFHKDTDDRHKLKVRAYEYDYNTPDNRTEIELPQPKRMMTLGLDATAEVKFLNESGNYNFQNMLDLNNEEFWPRKKLKKGKFNPRLIVNHGTFLSLKLTWYEFDRVRVPRLPLEPFQLPSEPESLRHFLEIAGAEIGLANNQKVAFTIDDAAPVLLPQVNGHSVMIEFDNLCSDNGKLCDFDHESRYETRRGDFHIHRDAFDLSIFQDKKYGLILRLGQLTADGFDIRTGKKPLGTDLAPCMAVGAGDAPELPPS